MGYSPYSVEKRLSLIEECYKSEMSVHSWCKENGIASGTFYSWMHYLKKSGFLLPENVPIKFKNNVNARNHDIVRVEVIQEEPIPELSSATLSTAMNISPNSTPTSNTTKIKIGDVSIEISDDINLPFLGQIIRTVRCSL